MGVKLIPTLSFRLSHASINAQAPLTDHGHQKKNDATVGIVERWAVARTSAHLPDGQVCAFFSTATPNQNHTVPPWRDCAAGDTAIGMKNATRTAREMMRGEHSVGFNSSAGRRL